MQSIYFRSSIDGNIHVLVLCIRGGHIMHLKHIPLEGAYNFRDLGGYPTNDKRYTRWGLLYRSDGLSELTTNDWAVLEDRNVKTIIDLRSKSEVSSAGIDNPEDIKYYNISLMKSLDHMKGLNSLKLDGSKADGKMLASMVLDYGKTVFNNIEGFVEVLNIIVEEIQNGSIVFICSAGKDRTGMIAALILYLSDVVREDIISDYIVSSTYNTHGINKKLDLLSDEILGAISNPESLRDVFDSKPETMIDLLEEFDSKDIRRVLDREGFSLESQYRLKEIFTKPILK